MPKPSMACGDDESCDSRERRPWSTVIMADSAEDTAKSSTQLDSSAVSQTPNTSQTSVAQQEQRLELLDKARAFLRSPQVQHEDALTKRRFLSEKGLTIPEIDMLLQEQVSR